MNIWVDADACPKVIKEILFRAAERTQTQTTLIANHSMRIPPSPYISHYQVTKGFDEADDEIVKRVAAGDIVISSDIPLAADAVKQGATVLSPRGERYTSANIQARLTMRDFMETMRASGLETSGPDALNHADRKRFADQLDQLLQQRT